jgi:hypothetical protein
VQALHDTQQHRVEEEEDRVIYDEEDYKADKTPVHRADDGSLRKTRYGVGRQPWDDIVDLGWGPAFAAGNVLKNLRRDKEPEHSLESARWYYGQLERRALEEPTDSGDAPWTAALNSVKAALTTAEKDRMVYG